MRRFGFPLLGAALIVLGAAVDHVLTAGGTPSQPALASPKNGTTAAISTAPSTSAIDAATEHAYSVASQSIVYVDNVGTGTGSGIIYDSAGDIVTNDHVVSGASKLQVTVNGGKTYTARIVGTDTADDLAVIHINAPGLIPAHFAGSGSYQVAQTVLAIGSPLGLQQSVTSGLISGLDRVEQEPGGAYLPNAIQTSAPINPGNSGGALVTLDGTVVGMPTLEQTSTSNGNAAQAIGFAIPSQRITYVASQIVRTGKVEHTGRAFLGISPTDASSSASSFGGFFGGGNGGGATSGALVQQVSGNGPAGRAGVQQGDVITSADGKPVTDAVDLLTVLATKKPGDSITLNINRNGNTQTVTVHLGELPATS